MYCRRHGRQGALFTKRRTILSGLQTSPEMTGINLMQKINISEEVIQPRLDSNFETEN